ncbi:MAG: phosphoglycerate mutase (2,3-diphosphoglycerate-independent), partial [Clostridia bacterium]|nr:phosphoglycerate mutase (2,3-diphosphoglycerate-independent) [Clostridia bacterium]
RDNRWDRVKRGYDSVFAGIGNKFSSALEGIKASYDKKIYNEFIEPIVVGDYDGVKENDSIVFYNFRSDRAREISRAAIYPDFNEFEREGGYKPVYYVGMTQYDATFTGIHTAFEPRELKNTLGEFVGKNGYTQARVAETEKYAHVTFFFNGGVEQPNEGEERVLVASPKVATYDLQPEMSAYEVTEKALEVIGKVDVLILNYANCDMVGHTGVFEAAVKAVETVDTCLSKLLPAIAKTGGTALVTADHGNAEQMTFEDGSPFTAHTTNLVPFILVGEKYEGVTLRSGGALCDVAPTLLDVMGVEKPEEMEGVSLIEK